MPPLSNKAKLLAANPSLNPDYLFDPQSDPSRLSDQFKQLSAEAPMFSHLQQKVVDKMMPIVGILENGHFVAIAQCDTPGCDSTSKWSCHAVPRNHSVAFTKFRNRKWSASKRGLKCPKCVARSKAPPVREFKREKPMNQIGEALAEAVERTVEIKVPLPILAAEIEQPPIAHLIAEGEDLMPTTTDTVAPTDKAKAAKRAAYALLLDHYDEGHKRYNGDWSDRKIAELVKMSEAFVAKIREDDFGPAGPPPQMIDLKERITNLETKLRQKETLVLSAMDEIPQMQEELGLVKSQFESLVKAHGWAS